MSGAKGIAKNLSALFSSHVIAVLQQVALVPLFLSRYGKAGYGEWLTLSAAVSYLGTLDFGVQTFVNQDLTLRFHRGEFEEFDIRQSTALRLLLGIISVTAILGLVVFFLPVEVWLHMDGSHGEPAQSHLVVCTAVYLLGLLAMSNIPYGYFGGSFMIEGQSYKGSYWNNAKYLSLIAGALFAVWFRASFAVVAAAQLGAMLTMMVGEIIHLKKAAPRSFPKLRHWRGSVVKEILGPSGHFAMIYSTNFIIYQAPIIILQRTVGPTVVTVFAIMRTIFSMTRNVLVALTQAIGPEVTTLFAKNEWKRLHQLYEYSERLMYSLIPAVNLGVLYLSPFLLTVWLKNRSVFAPGLYLVCAAISCVISTKEHKFQFQLSTNTHTEIARFMFGANIALVGLWMFAVPRWGIAGLLWAWFAEELSVLLYLLRLNREFFGEIKIDSRYFMSLTGLCTVCLVATYFLLPKTALLPLPWQVAIAIGVGLVILAIDLPLFGLREVATPFIAKLQQRFNRRATPQA